MAILLPKSRIRRLSAKGVRRNKLKASISLPIKPQWFIDISSITGQTPWLNCEKKEVNEPEPIWTLSLKISEWRLGNKYWDIQSIKKGTQEVVRQLLDKLRVAILDR